MKNVENWLKETKYSWEKALTSKAKDNKGEIVKNREIILTVMYVIMITWFIVKEAEDYSRYYWVF